MAGRARRPGSVPALAVLLSATACGGGTPMSTPSPPPPTPWPASNPDGWTVLETSPASPPNRRHDDVFFLDASTGWLVNARAEVHRTRDGGESWDRIAQLSGDVVLRCVGFASAEHGWAGNLNLTNTPKPDYALFETLDGGRTWSNISSRIEGASVAGLCGIRVLSPRTVVAVGRWNGPPVFVKTTDGGRTWRSRSMTEYTSGLVDVFFFNEHDGLAVGGLGDGSTEAEQRSSRTVILATSDGGETWQTRYVSDSAGQRAWKVQFVTDAVGYVSTEGPTPQGVVVKTTDGGRTWRTMVVDPGSSFEGVGFVSPERGWVASGQTLYATGDGGQSWRPLEFGRSINRMRVVNDGLVFACGDRVYRWTR